MSIFAGAFQDKRLGYLAAVLGIGAVTLLCAAFRAHLNGMTVSLAMLLVVLFVAAGWGSLPAYLAAGLGVLSFGLFFVPPVFAFTVTASRDWVALGAFLVTAFTAGQLSERARRREVALRESEANLNAAQKIAQVGGWHLDISRNRLKWTDEVFRIFDMPRSADLTYEMFFGKVHPEDRESVRRAWTDALHGAPYDIEYRLSADGNLKWVHEIARIRFDPRGRAVEGNGTVQDITERKHAETALQKSAEEIRDLYNRAPLGYHSVDKNGLLVRINDTELEWLGYTREEVIGTMRFADFLTPEGRSRLEEAFPRFTETGELRDLEFELVRKDGSILPVLLSATAVRDDEGNYLMSRSTVYDITGPKRAENEVRRLARFQAVVAELGEHALRHLSLSDVLDGVTSQVARILNVEFCKILELLPNRHALLLKSGVGWKPGYVGRAIVEIGKHSQAGYTLLVDEPVIVENFATEKRFTSVPLLEEHGVVSGVSVVISTKEGPYGILGAHTGHPRTFTANEVHFLQSVANVLGSAIERQRGEAELWRIHRAQRALSKCNEALVRAVSESALLQQICDIVVEEAGYRFCWVARAESDKEQSVRAVAKAGFEAGYLDPLRITWADTERGQGPVGTCIRTGRKVVVRNIATDPRMLPWREEALKRGYASCVAIPLAIDSAVFGALMIYASELETFGEEEVKLLSELASDLAFGIGAVRTKAAHAAAEEEIRALNADLEQRVVQRTAELRDANRKLEQAHEREIEVGFKIQQFLLLDRPPKDVPGLQVAALTVPSQKIDGDFYVFIRHEDQSLDVIVGDVMGKGVPAALLGAATKSQFLKALTDLLDISKGREVPEPGKIVMLAHAGVVNDLINLESFVTLSYIRVHASRRSVQLVDCGHTGLLHLHARTGVCEIVRGNNLPMGVREGEIYEQISVPLEWGDLLLLFSDGITDARNPAGDVFGMDRLQECVLGNRQLEPAALLETLRQTVFAFSESDRLSDDLTAVVIRVQEMQPATAMAEREIQSDPVELCRAREFVRDFCRGLPGRPLDEESVGWLELAVNEAASNIMKHAYHGRTGQPIQIEGMAFPGRVLIRLHHYGDPFHPAKSPLPQLDLSRESGFGLYLIALTTDDVRYYRDDRGRNSIELVKNCK